MTLRRYPFVAVLALAAASLVALHHGPVAPVAVAASEQAAAARVLPAGRRLAEAGAAELGMDPATLDAAVQFAQTRESNRAMDFSDQETHLRLAARLGAEHPRQDQRPRHLQGLRRRRVRRHDVGRSHLLGRQEHDGHRRRHRRARRQDHQPRRAGRPHGEGRRLRLAAQRAGHLEDAPAAGDRVGRRRCGARRTTSSARRRSATASASRAS